MNGRKVEDGGILYDENEADDEDELQESTATAAATPGMDWNEGGDVPEGLSGAELIQELVKRLPNSPASTACSMRPATCSMSARRAA